MANFVEENQEGKWPLKKKYRVKPEVKKGTYRNRTGGDAPPKKRNKYSQQQKVKLGIVPNVSTVLLLKDGKKRFIRAE